MAHELTPQRIRELNIAQQREQEGLATSTDVTNLEFARTNLDFGGATQEVADALGKTSLTDPAEIAVANDLSAGLDINRVNPSQTDIQSLQPGIDQAKQNIQDFGRPSLFTSFLKAATSLKVKPDDEEIGQSGLFKKAGLGETAASLNQSLQARSDQISKNIQNFNAFFQTASGIFKEQANLAINEYNILNNERNDLVGRLRTIDDQEKSFNNQLTLLQTNFENQKKLTEFESQFNPIVIGQDRNGGDILGRFNPKTNAFEPVVIKNATIPEDYLNPTILPGFEEWANSIGTTTSQFGTATNFEDFHPGIDIAAPSGTAVTPFVSGTIVETGVDNTFGNFVRIKDDEGNIWQYSHLSRIDVEEGQVVTSAEDATEGVRVIPESIFAPPTPFDFAGAREATESIGSIGSTGTTYSQFKGGDPSHLDIRVIQPTDEVSAVEELSDDEIAARSEVLSNMNLANEILNDEHLSIVTGLDRLFDPQARLSTTLSLRKKIDQIKSLLTLENRQKLKGQGTISDLESKILADAATTLDVGMTDEDFVAELTKIRSAFATSAGLSVSVLITNPNTGESQLTQANRTGIDQALADGLLVEYK